MLLFESLLLLTSSLPRNWRTCPKSSSASTHLRTMAKLPPCVASGICMDGDSSTTPKHPSHQCPPVFRPLDSRLLDHGLTSGDHGYRAVPATDRSRALHPMLATNLLSLPSLLFPHIVDPFSLASKENIAPGIFSAVGTKDVIGLNGKTNAPMVGLPNAFAQPRPVLQNLPAVGELALPHRGMRRLSN